MSFINMQGLEEGIIDVEAALEKYGLLEKEMILGQVLSRFKMNQAKQRQSDMLHSNKLFKFANKIADKFQKEDDKNDPDKYRVK